MARFVRLTPVILLQAVEAPREYVSALALVADPFVQGLYVSGNVPCRGTRRERG